jgi:hypothetical protein
MFKTTLAMALAAVAAAEPTLIESKMAHFTNDKYAVVITQNSGEDVFTMIERGTYGDPDPVCKNCTEKFNVFGIWNVAMTTLAKVNFTCKLMGVEAYSQDYDCTGAANDYGNCPTPAGIANEDWTADFGFDVPSIAPPFEYDVTITAYDTAGTELWQLGSNFYIQ